MSEHMVQLAAGQMLCVEDGRLTRISVQQGTGIITQEQVADDAEVTAGALFTVERNGKTILMASSNMVLHIAPPHRARVVVKKYVGSRPVILATYSARQPPLLAPG